MRGNGGVGYQKRVKIGKKTTPMYCIEHKTFEEIKETGWFFAAVTIFYDPVTILVTIFVSKKWRNYAKVTKVTMVTIKNKRYMYFFGKYENSG